MQMTFATGCSSRCRLGTLYMAIATPPRVTLPNPQAIGQLATERQTEGESERASERELNAINLYFIIYCAHIALRSSPASASFSSLWAKMF